MGRESRRRDQRVAFAAVKARMLEYITCAQTAAEGAAHAFQAWEAMIAIADGLAAVADSQDPVVVDWLSERATWVNNHARQKQFMDKLRQAIDTARQQTADAELK